MTLILNGTQLNQYDCDIVYNGNPVYEIICNDKSVWVKYINFTETNMYPPNPIKSDHTDTQQNFSLSNLSSSSYTVKDFLFCANYTKNGISYPCTVNFEYNSGSPKMPTYRLEYKLSHNTSYSFYYLSNLAKGDHKTTTGGYLNAYITWRTTTINSVTYVYGFKLYVKAQPGYTSSTFIFNPTGIWHSDQTVYSRCVLTYNGRILPLNS